MDARTQCVLDAAGGVLDELDLDAVIDRLLASARELTGARFAALGVVDAAGTGLERFVALGVDDAMRAEIAAPPRGHGVLGELILNPVPLRLRDLGQHPRSYGFPLGHPPMGSFMGVPILIGGAPFGSLYLTEKADRAEFTDADEESVVTLAQFAALAIDHARRYMRAQTRGDELDRRVQAFEATSEITRALGGATDLDVILELVAKRGRALVGARSLLIELVDGSELVVAAGAGELPERVLGARFALAETLASTALRTLSSQRLEVALNRARFTQHGLGRLGVTADAGLVVPLVFRGHSYGVLIALDCLRGGPEFTADDQQVLEAFATSAAIAVATARSAASELHRQRLAAAEDERGRWARELHDETLQSLGGLRVLLATARRIGDADVVEHAVDQAVADLDEGIANLRALVTELRPVALDDLGLVAAVEAMCDRAARNGLEIDHSLDLAYEGEREATRHTPELETAIYRIIQEALTNASKHGHARRAVIEAHETPTTVEIVVRDDGGGFDPATGTAGFGLLGMRERVELLDGTIEIQSSPGAGTKVIVSFPARRRQAVTGAVTVQPSRRTGTS